MKKLLKYLAEKLLMKQRFDEKLIINKDYCATTVSPKSFDELRKIIEQRYEEQGTGTKQNPIDFNDIDVSNIYSFYNYKKNKGIFQGTKFKFIDISKWDVSNATDMKIMFYECDELESVGDISKWDVSNVIDMYSMFYDCKSFNQDISDWDVSSVTIMAFMFCNCESFNQDLSGWNVSKVFYKLNVFNHCPIKEEYKPKFK